MDDVFGGDEDIIDEGSPQGEESNDGNIDDIADDKSIEAFMEENASQGIVGDGNDDTGDSQGTPSDDDESSPEFYSSIANSLVEEGVLDEANSAEIGNAQDLVEAMKRQVYSMLDSRQRRISDALDAGMSPDSIKEMEDRIDGMSDYTDSLLNSETDDALEARKELIYQAALMRGLDEEKAQREVDKSIRAATDIDDAFEARDFINNEYHKEYNRLYNEAQQAQKADFERDNAIRQKTADWIVNDSTFGSLPESTRRKVYENLYGETVKMNDGSLVSPVVAFSEKYPDVYNYMIGTIFTLTDGFRDFSHIGGQFAKKKINQSVKDIEKALRSTGSGGGGTYEYANDSSDRSEGKQKYEIIY